MSERRRPPLSHRGGLLCLAASLPLVALAPGAGAQQAPPAGEAQSGAVRPDADQGAASPAAASQTDVLQAGARSPAAGPAFDPVAADSLVYPGTLSPQTAVALAIARHPEIRGAEAQIARRKAEVALAKSDRLPTIQYGVGPGYGSSYGGGGNALGLRGNIGIDQPLWDFGATKNRIAAAKDLEEAARETKLDTVEKVARATLGAYIEAAASQERIAAAADTILAMRGVADRIGQRSRAGLADRSDVNAAGIAVTRAEVEAEQARTSADAAMSRLIQLIGVAPGGLVSLEESYAAVAGRNRAQPDFNDTPAIQAAARALDAAGAKERTARAERLPGIGVGASRTFSTGRASANDSNWVGFTLKGSFSLGGAGRQRVAAAVADRQAAEQELASRRLEAQTGWLVASREEEGARKRLTDLKGVSDLWQTTRDLYWQEYILDKRALSDVINAEREIHSARSEQIAALGEAASAAVNALVAQGGLVALLEQQQVPGDRPTRLAEAAPPPANLPAPPPVASQTFAEAFSSLPPSRPGGASGTAASMPAPFVEPPALPPPPMLAVVTSASMAEATDNPAPVRTASVPGPATSSIAASWRVQLGAFARPQGPDGAWQEARRHPALAGRDHMVVRTGSLNRLLAGPFADRATAQTACSALATSGRPCAVVAPDKGGTAALTATDRPRAVPAVFHPSPPVPAAPAAVPAAARVEADAPKLRPALDIEDLGLRGPQSPAAAPPRPAASAATPVAARMSAPVRAPTPASAPGAGTAGGWQIQLGAFSRPQGAGEAWDKVKRHPALAGRGQTTARTGTLTRLLAGPYTSRAAAQDACAALRASGHDACMAVGPNGKVN